MKRYTCLDCGTQYGHSGGHHHAVFECPARRTDRHSSNMSPDLTTTRCRAWPDSTWMMNPCAEGKGVPDDVSRRMQPRSGHH
jgi:hypothetical protein